MTSKSRRQALKLLASGMAILTIPFNPTFADEVPVERPYGIEEHMQNLHGVLHQYADETIQKVHGEFNTPEIRNLVRSCLMDIGRQLIRVGALDGFDCTCDESNNPSPVVDDCDLVAEMRYSYQGVRRAMKVSAKRVAVQVSEI